MKKFFIFMLLFYGISHFADEVVSYEFIDLTHFRVRPAEEDEFAKKQYKRKSKYKAQWTGRIGKGYKYPEVFKHPEKFLYHMQFFVKAVPEGSTPILILNNIAPDCAVLINHKKLKLIKKKIDKTNIFATEYWYEIPPKLFNTHIRKSPKGNFIRIFKNNL